MSANDKQVGGTHYDKEGEQHWDRVYRLHGRGYFVGCATKYIERYHLKNGKQDLEKAIHFIEKLIELEYPDENEGREPKKFKDKDPELKFNVNTIYGPTPPIYPENFAKYPGDYQEQLALKMQKMREDAMIGIPDHLRDEIQREARRQKAEHKMAELPDSLQGAISPMLKNFWGGSEEPMPHGYVNQDGPDVR